MASIHDSLPRVNKPWRSHEHRFAEGFRSAKCKPSEMCKGTTTDKMARIVDHFRSAPRAANKTRRARVLEQDLMVIYFVRGAGVKSKSGLFGDMYNLIQFGDDEIS
jgi:hypothetical protein